MTVVPKSAGRQDMAKLIPVLSIGGLASQQGQYSMAFRPWGLKPQPCKPLAKGSHEGLLQPVRKQIEGVEKLLQILSLAW